MIEFLQDCWHGLYKVLNTIACSFDHQSSNRKARRILLILKVLVHGQKDIEPRCGERQKFSVLDPGPSAARNGGTFVPYQQSLSLRGRSSSSRMRIWDERSARFLEHCHRQIAADRREVIQKDFQGIARFQVVEECLDGHPSPSEYGSAAVNLWVNGDHRLFHRERFKLHKEALA